MYQAGWADNKDFDQVLISNRDISNNHSEKPPVKLLESDLDFSPLEDATQFSSLAHLKNLISHDSLETESESIPRPL